VGTLLRWKASIPTEYGRNQGHHVTISAQCSCKFVWQDEEVTPDYTAKQYALELTKAHCGQIYDERHKP
jgi:hypothetical protein